MHYNEFDAVRRARQLIEEEDDDDDDSDGESSRAQCNYVDSNLDDNTMDVDDNNKQSTSSSLGHWKKQINFMNNLVDMNMTKRTKVFEN